MIRRTFDPVDGTVTEIPVDEDRDYEAEEYAFNEDYYRDQFYEERCKNGNRKT